MTWPIKSWASALSATSIRCLASWWLNATASPFLPRLCRTPSRYLPCSCDDDLSRHLLPVVSSNCQRARSSWAKPKSVVSAAHRNAKWAAYFIETPKITRKASHLRRADSSIVVSEPGFVLLMAECGWPVAGGSLQVSFVSGDYIVFSGLHGRAKNPDHQNGPGKRVFLRDCGYS